MPIALTLRELEVGCRVCDGLTTDEIAAKLSLRPATIDCYRFSLKKKLRVRNTSALMIAMMREGYWHPEAACCGSSS